MQLTIVYNPFFLAKVEHIHTHYCKHGSIQIIVETLYLKIL